MPHTAGVSQATPASSKVHVTFLLDISLSGSKNYIIYTYLIVSAGTS